MKVHIDARIARPAAGDLQQLGREIEARDARAGERRGDGDVAGTGGHVEQILAGRGAAALHEHVGDGLDVLGEIGIVADRPHHLLALLDCARVDAHCRCSLTG